LYSKRATKNKKKEKRLLTMSLKQKIQSLTPEKLALLEVLLTAPDSEWDKLKMCKQRKEVLDNIPAGVPTPASELAEKMGISLQSASLTLTHLADDGAIKIITTATITTAETPVTVELPRNYYLKD
jgi:predicted transcriptional regulator